MGGGSVSPSSTPGNNYDQSLVDPYGMLYLNSSDGNYLFVPDDAAIEGLKTNTNRNFSFKVTDSGSLSDSESFGISIGAVNDKPVAGLTTGAGVENAPFTFPVNATDPEGDAFNVTVLSGFHWTSGSVMVTNPVTNALVDLSTLTPTISIGADLKSIVITAPSQFDWMLTGQTINGTLNYTVAETSTLDHYSSTGIVNFSIAGSTADKGENWTGTSSNDTHTGTLYEDVIRGMAGNDTLAGGDRTDAIYGGNGNDILKGDGGIDYLFGENGTDQLFGGADNDYLYGGNNDDTLKGEAGNDVLYGENESDKLYGGLNDDTLYGGNGNDTLYGGDSAVELGNDILYGENGSDILYGYAGNDYLYGGNGEDQLDGGSGNDWLYGGNGEDKLTGGSGADYFVFSLGGGEDKIMDFKASEGDIIKITPDNGITSFSQLKMELESGGVEIELGGAGEIFLVGVTSLSSLTSSQFDFSA